MNLKFIIVIILIIIIALFILFKKAKKIENKKINSKKLIVIIISIISVLGTFAIDKVYNQKNITLIKKEIPPIIEKNISKAYDSDDFQEYNISNVQYEINKIYKQKRNGNKQYTVSVIIKCETDNDLSETEEELVAYELEDLFNLFDNTNNDYYTISNGTKISIRDSKTRETQITSIVNNKIIHKPRTSKEKEEELEKYLTKDKKEKIIKEALRSDCDKKTDTYHKCHWSNLEDRCICKQR